MANLEEGEKPVDREEGGKPMDFKKFFAGKMLKSKQELCHQVEFYFSDSNLYGDDFLNKVMRENDGWVPIKTLLTFTRVKSLVDQAQKDIPIVDPTLLLSEALRESKTLLRLSEDGFSVQRATPMEDPEVVAARTIAVFGFPSNRQFNADHQKKFWEQHGDVRCIRRYMARSRCMLLIEYAYKELAERVIRFRTLNYDGVELTIRKRAVPTKRGKARKRKRSDDEEWDETTPYTPDRVLKLVDLEEGTKWRHLRVWIENSGIAVEEGFFLKLVDDHAWIRLKGDVSAEDAVETLEETRWIDDEDPPRIEYVKDASEIWSELVSSPKFPTYTRNGRKRRKVYGKFSKRRNKKGKKRF